MEQIRGGPGRSTWKATTNDMDSPNSDMYVTVQLWADSKPLAVPVQTAYKAFKNKRSWMEWLTIPIHYCDLPLGSQLAITIWDLAGVDGVKPFGGTTVKLFDDDNTLKKGRQKCKIWVGREADGLSDTQTPSPVDTGDEMDRLEKVPLLAISIEFKTDIS